MSQNTFVTKEIVLDRLNAAGTAREQVDVTSKISDIYTGNIDVNVEDEVATVAYAADVAGSLNDTYYTFSNDGTDYCVWHNINGAGTDPTIATPALGTGIEVAGATGANAATLGAAAQAAIDAIDGLTCTGTSTITITFKGDPGTSIADSTAAPTGFNFTIVTAGKTANLDTIDSKNIDISSRIYGANAAGPAFLNEAASSTNPTLVPNKAALTTGVGKAANGLSLIDNGVEQLNLYDTAGSPVATFANDVTITNDLTVSNDAGITGNIAVSGAVSGNLSFVNATEATGGLNIKSAREVHTLAAAATSTTTTLSIPAGSMILGAQFNVDTAVTGSAANTWEAEMDDSATALLAAGQAGTQNTKGNALIVPEIAANTEEVMFTSGGGGNFTAGVIEVIVWYIDTTNLADA